MKILHLYKDYYPVLGGIENHIRTVAEAQAGAGHEVTVLVCSPVHRTTAALLNGVRVIKAGRLGTYASMPLSLAQPRVLMRHHPDIIHLHAPYPLGESANWICGRAPITIITYHADVVRQHRWLRLYGPLFHRILKQAACVISTSPSYLSTSPWLRRIADKCRVVPLGVDCSRFAPADHPRPPGATLLFVGRLRYYKGLDVLLRALPCVPEARLLVVGDGPMKSEWEQLACKLKCADRVHFCGEVSVEQLPSWYHHADVFVLPANSRAEAFGTVLLEAMAAGLPCITTELGTGTSWIVQHGNTGLVVPPHHPEALSEAIASLLADSVLRHRLGCAGRSRVQQYFTVERMIRDLQNLYQELWASAQSYSGK